VIARRVALAAALSAAALVFTPAGARAASACATAPSPGGEWRSYGHDYSNTRTQDLERLISPGDAPLLSPAWSFSTVRGGGEGDITGTPIVADGCLFTATNGGWIFALNADTGKLVWKAKLPYGGGINSTPGVAERACGTRRVGRRCGTVYVAASRTEKAEGCPPRDPCIGPYVTAVDERTGRIAFATRSLDRQPGSDTFGSPVIFAGALMIGVSGGSAELGDEADRYAFQGSMVFLDASSGRTLRKTWTIHPPKKPEDDVAGGGIWSTPAIDPARKVAYVGAGNPFRPQAEHPNTDSVLKYDVNRRSPRFGQIVGHYKGVIDEYFPALSKGPCYDVPGNPPPYYPQGLGSCGDLDMDFGAAPNLFTGPHGRRLVGAGQKSGVYHVFDAGTMKPVWTQLVGPPSAIGGIVGSTAYDGSAVFGPITAPGYLWSLKAGGGAYRWVAPTADGAHYGEPVAVANGVVYTVDLTGFLDAYDARTGAQLAKRSLALGGSGPVSLSWGGVSVARNTVYATVGVTGLKQGWVVAFRPGGVYKTVGDAQRTATGAVGGGGGGGRPPAGTAIVAVPGSTYSSYATPAMVTQVGGPLSFVNLDLPQHDVVSDALGAKGRPLFASRAGGLGQVVPVEGLERVRPGHTYAFHCSIHPGMRGTLIVR
jgi:polyvinyl alcohol dehydrogenase (cytochrome)